MSRNRKNHPQPAATRTPCERLEPRRLLSGDPATDAGTLAFLDTFDTSVDSLDVSFEHAARQAGPLAPLAWGEYRGSDWQQQIQGDRLLVAGTTSGASNGGSWAGVTAPNGGLAPDPGPGGSVAIDFAVNPVVDRPGYNRTQTAWAAVKFGATAPGQMVHRDDGFGVLFRGEGDRRFQAYDADRVVAEGVYTQDAAEGFRSVRVLLTSVDPEGRPFDGGPARVRAFVDGSGEPIFDHVRQSGFTQNYVTLQGNSEGANGDNVTRHSFDDFAIRTLPAAADPPDGLGIVSGVAYHDVNGNGVRDRRFIEGDRPDLLFVIDGSCSVEGSIVDAELDAASRLVEAFVAAGHGDTASVGILTFGADVYSYDADPFDGDAAYGPGLAGNDRDGDGVLDVVEVLQGITDHNRFDPPHFGPGDGPPDEIGSGVRDAPGTNYQLALAEARRFVEREFDPGRDANVVFLSDGLPNRPWGRAEDYLAEVDALKALTSHDVNLRAFGVAPGSPSRLSKLLAVDAGAMFFATTDEMLAAFGEIGGGGIITTEPGLPGRAVFADLDGDGALDPGGEPHALTRDDGSYVLAGVPAGARAIRQEGVANWSFTSPADGVHDLAVGAGHGHPGVDFGSRSRLSVDLDADSDNADSDGDGDPVDRTPYEDYLEALPTAAGTLLDVHDGDVDGDGVQDLADGFDADGTPGTHDDVADGSSFAPLVLDVSAPDAASLAGATVRFEYSADPAGPGGVYVPDPWDPQRPGSYRDVGQGFHLRLWRKDGGEPRSAGADYLAPGRDFALTDLAPAPGEPARLYVESLNPFRPEDAGKEYVRVFADPDGPGGPLPEALLAADAVRFATSAPPPDTGGGDGGDDQAPAAPANLTATGTPDGVGLSWDANAEPDLAGYEVRRWDRASQRWVRLHDGLLAGTTYADEDVAPGVEHQYSVVAVNIAGQVSTPAFAQAGRPGGGNGVNQPGGGEGEWGGGIEDEDGSQPLTNRDTDSPEHPWVWHNDRPLIIGFGGHTQSAGHDDQHGPIWDVDPTAGVYKIGEEMKKRGHMVTLFPEDPGNQVTENPFDPDEGLAGCGDGVLGHVPEGQDGRRVGGAMAFMIDAILTHGVTELAFFGYSHGGGSVRLITQFLQDLKDTGTIPGINSIVLSDNRQVFMPLAPGPFQNIQVKWSAYIDAVHVAYDNQGDATGAPTAEEGYATGSQAFFNIYQEADVLDSGTLDGGMILNTQGALPGAVWQINTDDEPDDPPHYVDPWPFPDGHSHGSIHRDEEDVHRLLLEHFDEHVDPPPF